MTSGESESEHRESVSTAEARLIAPTPSLLTARTAPPTGLEAVAGTLPEWDDFDAAVEEIYAARRSSRDRPAPELG